MGVYHVLDAYILYEMYFDSENKFRGNELKGIQLLRNLPQQLKFENSFQFINSYLLPYSGQLFYMPGDKNMKTLSVKLVDMNIEDALGNKCFEIENIMLAEKEINDKLFIPKKIYNKIEFHHIMAIQMGIPCELLRIKYTIPIAENDVFVC